MKIKKELTIAAILALAGMPVFGIVQNAHASQTYDYDHNGVQRTRQGEAEHEAWIKGQDVFAYKHGNLSKSQLNQALSDPNLNQVPEQNGEAVNSNNTNSTQINNSNHSQGTNQNYQSNTQSNQNSQPNNNTVQYSSSSVLPQTGETNSRAKEIAMSILLAGASAVSLAASKKLNHKYSTVKETNVSSGNDSLDNILENISSETNKLNGLLR